MNPYKILGITEQATDDEVKRAYRAMAAKYHPDVGGDVWVFEHVRDAYERIVHSRQPASVTRPPQPSPASPPTPSSNRRQPGHQPAQEASQQASQYSRQKPDQLNSTQSGQTTYRAANERSVSHLPFSLQRMYRILFQYQLPLQSETSFFILFNVLDIIFTNVLLRMHAIEANPMANYVLIHWGFNGMIAFKLVLVACVCLITQLIALHHLRRARQTLYLGTVIVGLVVAYSGYLLIAHR